MEEETAVMAGFSLLSLLLSANSVLFYMRSLTLFTRILHVFPRLGHNDDKDW